MFPSGSVTAKRHPDGSGSAMRRIAEMNLGFGLDAFTTPAGQFQNWQANCSLVLFEGFAKIVYTNSKSWGFHFLT